MIDKFIIREGDTVFTELEIKPLSKNWIIDSSGRSKIYSDDCTESSASIWIHAKIDKRYFSNVPEWMDFPEIIIPPKRNP